MDEWNSLSLYKMHLFYLMDVDSSQHTFSQGSLFFHSRSVWCFFVGGFLMSAAASSLGQMSWQEARVDEKYAAMTSDRVLISAYEHHWLYVSVSQGRNNICHLISQKQSQLNATFSGSLSAHGLSRCHGDEFDDMQLLTAAERSARWRDIWHLVTGRIADGF